MKNVNATYATSDLALATALVVQGYPVASLDTTDPKRVVLWFQECTALQDVIDSFWKGECFVDAGTFHHQLKCLKARIYSR